MQESVHEFLKPRVVKVSPVDELHAKVTIEPFPCWATPSVNRRSASSVYPDSDSSTCCQGRVLRGLRTFNGRPSMVARTKSGTIRSAAQSPPPMTLPARAVATSTPALARNESRYADVTSSAHALLLE
jgi:hypothetical protein